MGILLDKVEKDNNLKRVSIPDAYKENSAFFYNKYQGSDKEVQNTPFREISFGGFYFFHYRDESNWMGYSPVFTVEFKKFENKIIILALNFNFIPLEFRVRIFDNYMIEDDFTKNRDLGVDFPGIYNKLLQIGFEYSLVEYNMAQLIQSHRINTNLVPRFLYSGHPINKYDPKKLYEIMLAKKDKQKQRDSEMKKLSLEQLYKEAEGKNFSLVELKERYDRIQRNLEKFNQ